MHLSQIQVPCHDLEIEMLLFFVTIFIDISVVILLSIKDLCHLICCKYFKCEKRIALKNGEISIFGKQEFCVKNNNLRYFDIVNMVNGCYLAEDDDYKF